MLPTGTLLTDFDESEGGWHTGTMRQNIGKELISHGIDNANYGINSTSARRKSHPYVVAQLAAQQQPRQSTRMASGCMAVQGAEGCDAEPVFRQRTEHEVRVIGVPGLGITLDGFKGSGPRPADQINSTWGSGC